MQGGWQARTQGRWSSALLGGAVSSAEVHTMRPPQIGGCTLIWPLGAASLAPPPKCCLQHPFSPNSRT